MRLGRLLELAPDAEPGLRAQALLARAGSLDIFGESERAEPCYRESLALFMACGEDDHAANVRFRSAANMLMRGDADAAWPLFEAALEEFRERDMPLGEGQVLAFLGEKAFREGDLDRSCELFLESAAIAHEADWTWWELGQLASAAWSERARGRLDAADDLASRSLALAVGIGDRQHIVFAGGDARGDRGSARRQRAGPG